MLQNWKCGNPVSCAAGKAVLETIERENLQQNCSLVGDYLLKGLNNLQDKYECIGDVRGYGLMVGIDLVKNREKKNQILNLHLKFTKYQKI
ncbi:aminotransferase class III-fold pyridoxal phosphate-dependent enzyme [Hydrocoleum sp. CS-953]|uniref:aminotransferase class III-fold pyridoxal phosphate-dependent enzyme n=1 Tax=Hydrocoleum sp. CS-953 TaxID=1671698 RepID=UPI000B9C57CA